MDPISESDGNDNAVGSRRHLRKRGWFIDGGNPRLYDPNAASSPSNHNHDLPKISRRTLLDTSDSESERFEPASSKSPAGNNRGPFEKPEYTRISSHQPEPSLQSPFRRSRSESVQSGSNSTGESSSSNIPGSNLLFIDLPHPDRIHQINSGSVPSKKKSGSETSRRRENSVPSQFHKSCRVDPTHKVTSDAESIDSSCNNTVASSLPKPLFTLKKSSVSSNSKKRLHSGLLIGGPKIGSRGEQLNPLQWNAAPSGPVMIDHAVSGIFEDGTGSRHPSSHSNVESIRSSNVSGVFLSQNLGSQQAPPGRVFDLPLEPVTSKYNYELSGRHEFDFGNPINSLSSRCIHLSDFSYADVASSCCPNHGNQKNSHRESYITLEPAERDPRSVEGVQDRNSSTMLQIHPSLQMLESSSALSLNSTAAVPSGSTRPVNNQQKILHQNFNVQSELVDCTVPGRSERGSINQRNNSYSSITLASCQTSSPVGVVHSHQSDLRSNVRYGNRDSTRSGKFASHKSYMNTNPANYDSSNQENCISSESSDSRVVIMSLVYKKNMVAGSSYNSTTGQVYLLESVAENFEFCTTVSALRSVLPSIVVLPSSGATQFVKELKAKIEGDQTLKDCQFQCLSPRCFAYSFARRTVLESSLWEGCLTFRSEDAKKNAIVSNINLNDERLVCAFGGLLYHLSTGRLQLGAGMSPSPISSVQHVKLSNKLFLDTESFKNLHIFDSGEHPSSFKWSYMNREDGKSIFGLFERFCSPVGLTKLKYLLANPVNCRRTIEKRHEVMNFYLNCSNFNAVEALRVFTSQMSSSSVILSYLSSPTLRGGHWKLIYRHIYYTVSYAEVCRSHGDQSELFRELSSMIVDAVYSMAHNLEKVVDLVNMENNETFVIKYGFHPPLDAAKEKFSRLKMAMDKVTPYEFDSVPPFITRIQMMYIPEMKFLLSIPYWAPALSKEQLNLPNLEYKFTANETAFYKSRRCYELDELLGDAQTDIINEESIIIQSLRNYLKKHMHHIVGMAQKIAEIECIFALAKVAREERYTKPEIVDSCVIYIRGGWHPLLDVPLNEVITNDLVSSVETNLVKLIYGPNASGKSIYLKQAGLIMYLVHVGSYVPAVSARVGLFGRILARTTTEKSVISLSSTMLSELKKLQDAVLGCAKDTLVILDEVGKGSTEINCIANVTSAINYFLSQGSNCPHVLISTHLSGISDFVMSPPHCGEGRNLYELLSMDYTITEDGIVFLFKIRQGRPDGSLVFEVLENSKFAAPIVKTARTVLEALRTGESFLPYCETRIQRSHKYLNFIRKFVNIDMAKPGYLEKLQNKIQRYCEKPSY